MSVVTIFLPLLKRTSSASQQEPSGKKFGPHKNVLHKHYGGISLLMQHPKWHNKNMSMKVKQLENKVDTQGTNNTHFEQKHKEQKRHCQSFNASFLQPLCGARCLLHQKCVRDSTDVAVLSDSTIANLLQMG